jgi:hypothetical protein
MKKTLLLLLLCLLLGIINCRAQTTGFSSQELESYLTYPPQQLIEIIHLKGYKTLMKTGLANKEVQYLFTSRESDDHKFLAIYYGATLGIMYFSTTKPQFDYFYESLKPDGFTLTQGLTKGGYTTYKGNKNGGLAKHGLEVSLSNEIAKSGHQVFTIMFWNWHKDNASDSPVLSDIKSIEGQYSIGGSYNDKNGLSPTDQLKISNDKAIIPLSGMRAYANVKKENKVFALYLTMVDANFSFPEAHNYSKTIPIGYVTSTPNGLQFKFSGFYNTKTHKKEFNIGDEAYPLIKQTINNN